MMPLLKKGPAGRGSRPDGRLSDGGAMTYGGPKQDAVIVFDTTLRDGEQSPGATMTADEKLEVADALVELGVDIIEAGFPAASPGDFEAVRLIAKRVKGVDGRRAGPLQSRATSSGRRRRSRARSRPGSTHSSPPPTSTSSTSCG